MTELLECINPAQVDDADYLAAIEDDVRPAFASHLEKCRYCQRELETYRAQDQLMHRQFAFISGPERALCGETQRLGEFILKMLTPVESKKLDEHIKHCQYCAAEVVDLEKWLPEPQPLARSNEDGPLYQLRRVIAHLLNPGEVTNKPNFVMAGVRGSDEGLPQTYQAEEVSITVTIQALSPHSKSSMVLGLVQCDNQPMEATAGAKVCIRDAETILATETVDELGNFIFAEVTAPDHFDLEITLEDKIVLVPNLSLN